MHPLAPSDPTRVGPYRLIALLGAGGMGRVYLGLDRRGRPAAVKVVRSEHAYEPAFRARFADELDLARRAQSENVPRVYDADAKAETPWMATEYVMGPSLQHLIETTGPLPEHSAVHLARGVAQALVGLHAGGLTHRDLKPANVMVSPHGARVIDFGIARALVDGHSPEHGKTVGTPGYMAPETGRGEQTGPPADVFALGGVLTWALTGQGPFGAGHPSTLLYRSENLAPELGRVPENLRPLIAACLDKDPARRPTAVQVLQALGGPAPHEPTAARWLPPAPASAVDAIGNAYRARVVFGDRSRRGRGLLTGASVVVALILLGGFGLWALDGPLPRENEDPVAAEPSTEPEPATREVCDPTEHLAPEFTEAAASEPTIPSVSFRVRTSFSHDGSVLAVAGDQGVALWDWENETELALIESRGERSDTRPHFSPNDCLLAWGTEDGALVYSLETGELTTYAEGRDISDTLFSLDGTVLTVADRGFDSEGSVYDIDLESGETLLVYERSSGQRFLTRSPDGEHLAGLAGYGAPTVWETEVGRRIFGNISGHSGLGVNIELLGDGEMLIPREEGPFHYDFLEDSGSGWAIEPEFEDEDEEVAGPLTDFVFNPEADRLYAVYMAEADEDGGSAATLSIWEYGTGDHPVEATSIDPQAEVLPLRFGVHPGGEVVSAIQPDTETVLILDADDLRELQRLG
ncbi:WD40 repeat domain-containing serine/threonine protein kinase [Nocardiopsis alba]